MENIYDIKSEEEYIKYKDKIKSLIENERNIISDVRVSYEQVSWLLKYHKKELIESLDIDILIFRESEPEIQKILIEAGLDLTTDSCYNIVSSILDIKVLELALSNGLDVNQQDEAGCNALMHLVSPENKELIEFLIKNGIDVHHENASYENIAFQGYEHLQKLALKYNIDLSGHNSFGFTPMFECSTLEICKEFIKRGVDLNMENTDGEKCFFYTVKPEIFREIFKNINHRNIYMKNNEGENCLFFAKNIEILKEMLTYFEPEVLKNDPDILINNDGDNLFEKLKDKEMILELLKHKVPYKEVMWNPKTSDVVKETMVEYTLEVEKNILSNEIKNILANEVKNKKRI